MGWWREVLAVASVLFIVAIVVLFFWAKRAFVNQIARGLGDSFDVNQREESRREDRDL